MSLLRALQANEPDARRKFFVDVIACRRRVRHKHEETPLYQVLTVKSEFDVLRLHGLLARVQDLIQLGGSFFFFLLLLPSLFLSLFLSLSLSPRSLSSLSLFLSFLNFVNCRLDAFSSISDI